MIALSTVNLGLLGEIHAGQEIPETYPDNVGGTVTTDFDRLAELGIIDQAELDAKRDADALADLEAEDAAQVKRDELAEAIADARAATNAAEIATKAANDAARAAVDAVAKLKKAKPADPPAASDPPADPPAS